MSSATESGMPKSASPEALPLRLNLGCGFDLKEGYLNVDLQDFHKPDLVADVTKLPMLPSGHFEEVLAQDVLEHIPRLRVEETLAEWSRLVRPGGCLRLRVPNLLALLDLLAQTQRQGVEEQRTLIQCLYGTQAYEGDFHLHGFTPRSLVQQLETAGFANIQISQKDGWLMEVVAGKGGNPDWHRWNLLGNDAVCISGWHRLEREGSEHFRWSQGRSLINLRHAAGRRARLVFTAFSNGPSTPAVQMQLSDPITNTVLETLQIDPHQPRSVELQIGTDDFLLEVISNATFAPQFFLRGSTDERHLGVGLRDLQIV